MRPDGVPEDWVLRDCATNCGQMVWVPDVSVITPVCSVDCAVIIIDAYENIALGREHINTPECWCGPAVSLTAEGSQLLEHR